MAEWIQRTDVFQFIIADILQKRIEINIWGNLLFELNETYAIFKLIERKEVKFIL